MQDKGNVASVAAHLRRRSSRLFEPPCHLFSGYLASFTVTGRSVKHISYCRLVEARSVWSFWLNSLSISELEPRISTVERRVLSVCLHNVKTLRYVAFLNFHASHISVKHYNPVNRGSKPRGTVCYFFLHHHNFLNNSLSLTVSFHQNKVDRSVMLATEH